MHRILLLCAFACTAAALPAQLAGTYLIDPTGGPPNFTSLQAAVNAAVAAGVAGPVSFQILPGTYTESVTVPPIPGTSATNTVTFQPLVGAGTVRLIGSTGDTFALSGVSTSVRNHWLVFDGLDFDSAPGIAISGTIWVEAIEIRNCSFGPNHRPASGTRDAIIVSENNGSELGWKVHHNRFTFPSRLSRTAYGIYLSNGGDWSFHDNTIDLNGCNYGLYMINQNRRLDTVYNNVFFGSLYASTSTSPNSVAVIRADISNYANDFVHNTFFVTVPGLSGCIIATRGLSGGTPAAHNLIYGNVFVMIGPGTCIVVNPSTSLPNPYFGDGNLFWAPGGEIGRTSVTGAGITTLAAWQAATGQDAASAEADPMFANAAASPPDLHVLPGSPIVDLAVNTPIYVDHDRGGRLRDPRPDAGAYESSGFAFYGSGCAGTGSNVPAIASSGQVALGSTSFAVDLQNALPGSLALLFAGFSRTAYNSVPLPFAIGGGCQILAAPQVLMLSVTDVAGAASQPLPIPNIPTLFGRDLFLQWAVLDPGSASAFGLAVSQGGALQI